MRPDLLTADAHSAEADPEVVRVDTHRVWCDGGEGALGHPRVYMEMGAAGFVDCGYCDRRFVLGAHVHDESQRLDPADYEGAAGA